MRRAILSWLFLLLAFWVWAQGSSADKTRSDAIQRVKMLLVSALDRGLPKVSLEFFLNYEGEGAPIQWEVNDCSAQARDTAVEPGHDSAMCVQAEIGLKDGRAATVLISVGTLKRGLVDVPRVYAVRVTNRDGTVRHLERLSDLPVELHRPLPKGPKDLPPPFSARLQFLKLGRCLACVRLQ